MSQNMTEKKSCAHEGCKCPAQEGQAYCSDHCKQCGEQSKGAQHKDHDCHCHHQQCGHHSH